MERKQLQRILIVVFGLAFIGSTGVAIISGLLSGGSNRSQSSNSGTTEIPTYEEQLASQAKGYRNVLEREPENLTALQGLLQVSLQQGNLEGAIAPLETLIALNPNRSDFQDLLEEINIRLVQQSQPAVNPETVDPANEATETAE